MSTALTGNFSAECLGIIKHAQQGLARTRIALCQRPGADTEETGRYDLAWKDLCSVLNALSKKRIIKGNTLCSWIFVTHRKTPALARFSLYC